MANPEIQFDVSLNDSDYQKGVTRVQGSAKNIAKEFRSLGVEIQNVSRTLTFFGGAVTASMTATFAKAAKDIPAVDQKLKDIGNSFQALADNVALAALPSLNEFAKFLNGTVAVVSKFAAEHQAFVNGFIQYGGIALMIGMVGNAFGMLIKTLKDVWLLGSRIVSMFIALWSPITLVVGAVISLVAALAWLSDKFLGTNWIDDAVTSFKKLGATVQGFFKDFEVGTKQTTQRSIDLWGQFTTGLKSHLNTISENMKGFGASVSQSMEKAFGDTIFNVIKGNFKDLKSIIMSFADDILRAFSKMAANQFLAMLFGNKEGGTGIFSSLGAMLGFQGKSPVKETTKQFEDLTQNMKYFGREKDKVIDKLKDFGRGLDKASPGKLGAAGAMAGGAGIGGELAIDVGNFSEAEKATAGLNAMLAGTVGLVAAIGAGFDMVGLKIIKVGITYAVTQAAMLAVSIGAAVAQVAIGTATAAALAAAWVVPALLASIATLGGAAAIGTAAVGAAMAATGGMVAAGFSAATAGGAGGLPAGAGITMGEGAFPKGAEGGIVTRPTLALIGEAGPEAVVPLNKTPGSSPLGRGGSTHVSIDIKEAILNSPSNMMDFIRLLKQELAR
jgi:hypothetical protein